MPYTQSLNLVILVNGIGVPARVLPGFVADRYLGVLNTFFLCIFLCATVLWAWLGVSGIPGYYAFITLYGVFSAAFQSLVPTTVAALSSDMTKTGTRLGMALTAVGLSALVGGPISGAMLKSTGGYNAPIYWASASSAVGVGLCWWARCVKHGWARKKC
jgi:predicted MFS family arabinose efflux permease